MMTIAPIRSSEHAVGYFERSDHADYYALDEVCPSSWEGQTAEVLGIRGQAVDPNKFKRYLSGEVAGVKLGSTRKTDKCRHKPGFDLQFSPPKSVSIAALVGGDRRIIEAHNKAVSDALSLIEEKAIFTRVHTLDKNGEDQTHHHGTGNLLAAVFRHETSRKLDPQLHSHAIILNLTKTSDAQWRSIESRHFYCLQKEIGLLYRQNLAVRLLDLGYELERKKGSTFEIKQIPESVINAFSQRKSEIDKTLAELGYTRDSAPASLKEKIAHTNRDKKQYLETNELHKYWSSIEEKYSFSSKSLVRDVNTKSMLSSFKEDIKAYRFDVLRQITEESIKEISERESVFSQEKLFRHINEKAVGYGVSDKSVKTHVSNLLSEGRLIGDRQIKVFFNQFQEWKMVDAFTTPQALNLETEMITLIQPSANKFEFKFDSNEIEKIITRSNQDSLSKGYEEWNSGQKTALRNLLSSSSQFLAIQGYAGTAKTTTVLKTLAKQFELKGVEVIGMAPSASACQSLKQGAEIKHVRTVASHLLENKQIRANEDKQLWLVDEASLLSTRDMVKLLKKAVSHNAKVVLVGDIKQLGSVDAGSAFKQLQQSGLTTFVLDEIVRQTNDKTLQAVQASIKSQASEAIKQLQDGGGAFIELPGDASLRASQIVNEYINLSKEERRKTILIDPSIEGRNLLNKLIREELKQEKEIEDKGICLTKLDSADLTKTSQKDLLNYSEGNVIKFLRDYKRKGVEKNSYWVIEKINTETNTILIRDKSGKELIWNPQSSNWGKKLQVFEAKESELCVGDRIVWTSNDRRRGLINGMKAKVINVDRTQQEVHLHFNNDVVHKLTIKDACNQHWNYDYATTAHAAQGMTAERVIYHAESFRRNLASQKAFYVSISRAKKQAIVYTDNKNELISQIQHHSGEKQNAIEYEQDLGLSIN
jgi:conjugative relaxase-like TrwC/TraI family protein